MNLPTIPETYRNADWPRKVKQAIDSIVRRVVVIEQYTVETLTFSPIAEPASPVEGLTYLDSTTDKLRTYAGGVWNDHW